MKKRLAVVIAVDGLRASALGTYGNTTFATPHFNELASRSLVVERLFAQSPSLDSFYHDAWGDLPRDQIRKWLLTDESAVAELERGRFEEVLALDRSTIQRASDLAEAHTARFFASALEQLALWLKDVEQQAHERGLLWIHFSGLCGSWDAPMELRKALMEDAELETPDFITPPTNLSLQHDPDELWRYRVAYAAQIAVLETYLAKFIETFEECSEDEDWLIMVVGTRGFSLGEHGKVGSECGTLYSEQLHLPWLISSQQTQQPLPRILGFAKPADVAATLSEWLGTELQNTGVSCSLIPALREAPVPLHNRSIATNSAGHSSIRTRAWMLHVAETTELYAKPDDQWEANNIVSLCPDVVELLNECLQSQGNSTLPLHPQLESIWR